MNRPAKGFVVPMAFFLLRLSYVGKPDKPPLVRVLQGPPGGSYIGDGHSLISSWRLRYSGEGLPHFREAEFRGEFPIATVTLRDPSIPLRVFLEAFNPFIPLNDKDSSIPAAILRYHLENLSDEDLALTLFGNITNVIGGPEDGRVNEARKESLIKGLYLSARRVKPESPRYGSMALATIWPTASVWPKWKEKGVANIMKFWEVVTSRGDLPSESGSSDTGTVAVSLTLKPREEKSVTFIIAWHFPNFEHYWGGKPGVSWRNYYATLWKDAWDVARYVATNLDRLWRETKLFHDALFSSTLPAHVLDAVSSQLSTLKTNTCLRLEDGTFYGFEGCSNDSGCCEGSCTHVWNYAQALPYLFPNLQRSMLDAHLENSVMDDGFMVFRMPLPLGTKAEPRFHPAADGQMGIVLQTYREWLISGDDLWLRSIWPKVKRALEFAWRYWDADRDGVMEGMQHNTYDIEFYGPNTMMGSLYLAALRAAEEMAQHLGDMKKAQEYRRLFERGSGWTDENLFNGEYYEQKVNPEAHEAWPEPYRRLALRHGWDDRFEWPRWQYGRGCLSDQLIGQWYSHMLGLGYLYKPENVRKALESIFKYNWKPTLWDHPCTLRIYAVDGEAGLVLCTWPKGGRPGYPFYYADEVWCGVEYQVASHMIYEGMLDEGLAIVMGTRNRYRGDRRNPWDEFECGHHYARSMASYALLLALSGFSYSAPEERIGFNPRISQNDFRVFFSVASGWGVYTQRINKEKAEFTIDVKYGTLTLQRVDIPSIHIEDPEAEVLLDDRKIEAQIELDRDATKVTMKPTTINRGQKLRVILYKAAKRRETGADRE
ncbi:MAG: hypothetical protein AYL32_014020 [Candidatus Bathyarchaeota archaeon B26-2]|nr:MAG: hypothetical protein AYL32_014020 [Candidatus Bathyarchaeota archaeon B26-2]